MTWEEPPPRVLRRPWLLAAGVGVAVLAALTVLVLVARDEPPSVLTVGPTRQPDDPGLASAVDPRDFVPERLPPLEVATERAGDGALLPDPPQDLTIIAADDTGLQIVDADTGDQRRVQVVRGGPASLTETLFVVGDSVIFDADADVVRIREGDVRPLRVADSHRAIRTIDDRSVWVFDNFSPFVEGVASRVSFDDGAVRHQVRLPSVAQPLVGTADGLVVGAPGAISYVSADGDRRLVARGMAVATDGDRLAWLQCADDMSCAVILGTLDDPDQVRTTLDPAVLPAGFFGLPTGTFSPDGRWLALPLYQSRGRRGVGQVTVTVLDARTGAPVFGADGSSLTPFNTPLAWSPDSQWLVFMSDAELRAWRPGADRSTVVEADLRAVRALAVR